MAPVSRSNATSHGVAVRLGAGGRVPCPGARRAPCASGSRRRASAGSRSPVAASSRLRSSTAVSESKPRSLKARVSVDGSAAAWPRTAAACPRTRSSRTAACSAAAQPGQPAERGRRRSSAAARRCPAGRGPDQAAQHGAGPRRPGAAQDAGSSDRDQDRARRGAAPRRAGRGPARRSAAAMPDRGPSGRGRPRPGARSCRWPRPTGPRPARSRAGPGAAVLGERVEEGVGGGVVGLARRCRARRRPRRRGRTRRGRGRAVSSCRCQAASTLGRSTASSRSGVSDAEHAVVEDAGRVHDRGQRVLGRDAGEQRRPGRPGRRRRRRRPGPRRPARRVPRQLGGAGRVAGRGGWPAAGAAAPCSATRCRATRAPSVPVPPVIRTVPSGSSRARAW